MGDESLQKMLIVYSFSISTLYKHKEDVIVLRTEHIINF